MYSAIVARAVRSIQIRIKDALAPAGRRWWPFVFPLVFGADADLLKAFPGGHKMIQIGLQNIVQLVHEGDDLPVIQAGVADEPADDVVVLGLYVGVVVLVVGAAARQLYMVPIRPVLQEPVNELAPRVRVHTLDGKGYLPPDPIQAIPGCPLPLIPLGGEGNPESVGIGVVYRVNQVTDQA